MSPMANFHSCRLKPPDYDKYAYEKCKVKHDGKCIDFVYGIIGPDESELQSMRYSTDIWTEGDAKDHCKENDGTFEPAKEEESKSKDELSQDTAERRYLPIQEMKTSRTADGKMIIEGYPIVYEKYADIWGFKEIIRQGAATNALERSDEFVLWDHESGQPMAARKNGTLEVKEDEHGVHINADVSKSIWGRNGYEAIQNGIVDKMSFCFDLAEDIWFWKEFEDIRIEVREIVELREIYDYSPVAYPAYKDTKLIARSKFLALRNHPDPETSGKADAAALEVLKEARDNLNQLLEVLRYGH